MDCSYLEAKRMLIKFPSMYEIKCHAWRLRFFDFIPVRTRLQYVYSLLVCRLPPSIGHMTSIPHPSRDSTLYVAGLRDLPSINLTVTYFPFILTRTPPNSPRRAYTPFASLILFERENRRERKQSRESMGFTKGWVCRRCKNKRAKCVEFFLSCSRSTEEACMAS